jgi:enterochelin esterase-like enzyme
MKKLFIAILSLSFTLGLFAQTGKISDNLTLPSKLLKMERKYAIYLPPDYETSQRSYPVLYLLHGGGDNQTGWVQFGEILNIADNAIKSGIATSMIIVMPDANAGKLGNFNDVKGDWRYEDFFFQEFIPFIEKTYRIKTDKQYRAVSGLSMGGEAAFIYALHHPELFSSSCPLSAAVGENLKELKNYYWWPGVEGISDAEQEPYFKLYSVLSQIENMSEIQSKAFRSVRWYFDCGDDDDLSVGNSLVHIAMLKQKIPHEFRVREGAHNWTYWRTSLPNVLEFVSMSFHQL